MIFDLAQDFRDAAATMPRTHARCLVLTRIQEAIDLASHVLATSPLELRSQLVGRLCRQADPAVAGFVGTARRPWFRSWLRPLTASLSQPGGPLLRSMTNAHDPAFSLSEHAGQVFHVRVTPGGHLAVVWARQRPIAVWQLECGHRLCNLPLLSDKCAAFDFTPDGLRMVAAVAGAPGSNPRMQAFDLTAGVLLWDLDEHEQAVTTVVVTADGARIVSGDEGGNVFACSAHDGRPLLAMRPFDATVSALVAMGHSRFAVAGAADGRTVVLDLNSAEVISSLGPRGAAVTALAATSDNRHVVVSYEDATLILWNIRAGREVRSLGPTSYAAVAIMIVPGHARALCWSAPERHTLWLQDLGGKRSLTSLTYPCSAIWKAAVALSAERVVSWSVDGELTVWDMADLKPIRKAAGHAKSVVAADVVPDGRLAVTASRDGSLHVWDVEKADEFVHPECPAHSGYSVDITPDAARAVSLSGDGQLMVWDVTSGALLHSEDTEGGAGPEALAVMESGQIAVGCTDGEVRLWSLHAPTTADSSSRGSEPCEPLLRDARRFFVPICDSDAICGLGVAQGGRLVALTTGGRLCCWDPASIAPEMETWGRLCVCAVHLSVAPLGPYAASIGVAGTDVGVYLWDLRDRTPNRRLIEPLRNVGVSVVALIGDGRQALLGCITGEIALWDIPAGKPIAWLDGHCNNVTGLRVSRDGRRAVSGSKDRQVRVWDLERRDCLARFTCEAPVHAVAADAAGTTFVAGDERGRLHFLRIEEPTGV